MAKAPDKTSGIVSRVFGMFDFTKITGASAPTKQTLKRQELATPSLLSDLDRSKVLEKAMSIDMNAGGRPNSGQMGLGEYLQSTVASQARERSENERIIRMVPELAQARDILLSSIEQPNNLTESQHTILCRLKSLSSETSQEIRNTSSDYFEELFELSTAFERWTDQAYYTWGSKPLLIVPLGTMAAFLDAPHKERKSASLEDFKSPEEKLKSKIDRATKTSMFGFSDYAVRSDAAALESYSRMLGDATTSSFDVAVEEIDTALRSYSEVSKTPFDRKKISEKPVKEIRAVVKSVIGSLEVIDNPGIVAFTTQLNNDAQKNISKKLSIYSDAPELNVSAPKSKDKVLGRGILIEPPPESIVPLFTPGSPDDHIGYIGLLNEYGHFINVASFESDDYNGNVSSLPSQNPFGSMFQAYGFNSLFTAGQGMPGGQAVMANIYQNIIEAHLQRTATASGFGDIKLGMAPSVLKCMMSRYFQHRRTRLLFIPKELMIYYRFKTASNGTGVSKIDEMKYVLSLRISLMVMRMMAAFNGAIDRRLLTITFPEKFRSNPIEHINILKNQYIVKNALTLSTEPELTAQQILMKGITVKAENMPGGAAQFAVSNEPNERTSTPIDDNLFDDVKHLTVMATDVPAYALNSMGEQEYSRSIATTDLAFARRIVKLQNIACKYLTQFVRTWARYDEIFRTKLKRIAEKELKDIQTGDVGTADINGDGKFTVDDIIDSLEFTLPKPIVAPSKSQFENITDMAASTKSLLELMWPDEMAAGDTELQSTIAAIRALLGRSAAYAYMTELGVGDIKIPTDADAVKMSDVTGMRFLINNVRNANIAIDKIAKKKAEDQGGGYGGGFDGGMGGDFGAGGGDAGMGGTTPPDMGGGDTPSPDFNDSSQDAAEQPGEPGEGDITPPGL